MSETNYERRVQLATSVALHEFAHRVTRGESQEGQQALFRECAWRAAHSGARVPVSAVYRAVGEIDSGRRVV
jgi:hypothetical protein